MGYIFKEINVTRFLRGRWSTYTYIQAIKMSKVDAPLDEVALKKQERSKKTDKAAKKDKKKVKQAKQVDAGLQLFKGKASELDGVFGKGVSSYAYLVIHGLMNSLNMLCPQVHLF